ncbi:MAG: hypothetical protein GXY83_25975 [Rhodopirellula sp.]|nr:hypothetical protein [Rhodopirellula sp.]
MQSDPGRRAWRRISAFFLAAAVAVLAATVFGRGLCATLVRQSAARALEAGAISQAQSRLAWSAWLDPGNGKTDLLEAECFRHLQQLDRWQQSLQSAQRKGVAADAIRHEGRLGLLQSGERVADLAGAMADLIGGGVAPHEVATAVIHGCLAREEPETAQWVFDGWAANSPREAQVAYMAGVIWRWLSEPSRAEEDFQRALGKQPRHELAREALVRLYEDQYRLDEALRQQIELARTPGAPVRAQVALARLLRKRGYLGKAKAVLEPLASAAETETSSAAAFELGQIDLDSGSFQGAIRRLEHAAAEPAGNGNLEVFSSAALVFSQQEDAYRSERLFTQVDNEVGRSLRIHDLRVRLVVAPGDASAADELKRLTSVGWGLSLSGETDREQNRANLPESEETSVKELYLVHCAACHGAEGGGDGHAARHLFPRPRDLRVGKSRLVSTLNSVATPEDLRAVLRQGMPGSSMPSFAKLGEDQRELLVEELLRLNRTGIEEQLVEAMQAQGEEIDADELREALEFCTVAGDTIQTPRFGASDARSISEGERLYENLGCNKCHGEDGMGAADLALFDENGLPTTARDLVRDPFKGGHEPESVYLRVYAGMPGTPHPSCRGVPEEQLVDLVQYCLSLSREPKRFRTNYERAAEAAARVHLLEDADSPAP